MEPIAIFNILVVFVIGVLCPGYAMAGLFFKSEKFAEKSAIAVLLGFLYIFVGFFMVKNGIITLSYEFVIAFTAIFTIVPLILNKDVRAGASKGWSVD